MFKRILIANRGEIAIRVINAARELGVESVAIFHDIDRKMPYVQYADFAYELRSDTPKSGYLDIDQIIEIAKKSGSEAIHPGYGFLSENADFSQACEDSGIKFIGPKPYSIKVMGSKTEARRLMQEAGVPIVPGTKERMEDFDKAKEIANEIGYPIILKAAAGGGGKGMKLVEKEDELIPQYEAAQREAIKSFGDDLVYFEKFIVNPKHIEIQLIADQHGNYVHLGERDCSVQRRHQKVIEESPSNVLTPEIREKMGQVALDAARACDYQGAGTVEFLLDKDLNFYFLEMNTRLQVEHPVTEMVTGRDLAKEMIRTAAGERLSFTQDEIKWVGHSIECRIYAEDPQNNFMPDIGPINYLKSPGGFGVRVDGGIDNNTEVSLHFDPMLSKLITYGKDRNEAIDKMITSLKNYKIMGFKTIIPFLEECMKHPEFRDGWFDTGFINKKFDFTMLEKLQNQENEILAAIAAHEWKENTAKKNLRQEKRELNNWKVYDLRERRLG